MRTIRRLGGALIVCAALIGCRSPQSPLGKKLDAALAGPRNVEVLKVASDGSVVGTKSVRPESRWFREFEEAIREAERRMITEPLACAFQTGFIVRVRGTNDADIHIGEGCTAFDVTEVSKPTYHGAHFEDGKRLEALMQELFPKKKS